MKRLPAFCAAIVATTTMLTGCFSSSHDSQGLPEVKADYEETARSLTWPADHPWRSADERYRSDEAEEPANYQTGYGKTDAGNEWMCAWKLELLDAVKIKSKIRKQAAIDMLATLPTLYAWQRFDDGMQKSETEMLAKARLGDFSEIKADAEVNC